MRLSDTASRKEEAFARASIHNRFHSKSSSLLWSFHCTINRHNGGGALRTQPAFRPARPLREAPRKCQGPREREVTLSTQAWQHFPSYVISWDQSPQEDVLTVPKSNPRTIAKLPAWIPRSERPRTKNSLRARAARHGKRKLHARPPQPQHPSRPQSLTLSRLQSSNARTSIAGGTQLYSRGHTY